MNIQKIISVYQKTEKVLKITVNGDSMRPTLNSGDKVWIRFEKRDPRLGDIVLFYVGDGYVIHRIVKCLKSGRLVTKGDDNFMWDGISICANDVVGFAEIEYRFRILVILAAWLSYCEGKWNSLAYSGRACMRRLMLTLGAFSRHLYRLILNHKQIQG